MSSKPRPRPRLARKACDNRTSAPAAWSNLVILSDRSLREAIEAGRLIVDPLDDGALQPSSIDIRLDSRFRVFHNARYPYIDLKQPMEDLTGLVEVKPDDAFILHPGEFVLGSSLETIGIPPDLAARLEGKSSLGRLGLLTHSTAGFLDPGFQGHVTLELSNVANLPITLYPGMRIGQIAVFQLTTPAERPYGSGGVRSKYQGPRGPTPSPRPRPPQHRPRWPPHRPARPARHLCRPRHLRRPRHPREPPRPRQRPADRRSATAPGPARRRAP